MSSSEIHQSNCISHPLLHTPVSQQQSTRGGLKNLKRPGGETWRMNVWIYACLPRFSSLDMCGSPWCMSTTIPYEWFYAWIGIGEMVSFSFVMCELFARLTSGKSQRRLFDWQFETSLPVSPAAFFAAEGSKHLLPDNSNTWPSSLSSSILGDRLGRRVILNYRINVCFSACSANPILLNCEPFKRFIASSHPV